MDDRAGGVGFRGDEPDERWIWNASAPISDTIAFDTAPFNPWISDTTAMIDVTATMLPSTVSSDRSLFDQIALRAMPMASMNLFM